LKKTKKQKLVIDQSKKEYEDVLLYSFVALASHSGKAIYTVYYKEIGKVDAKFELEKEFLNDPFSKFMEQLLDLNNELEKKYQIVFLQLYIKMIEYIMKKKII